MGNDNKVAQEQKRIFASNFKYYLENSGRSQSDIVILLGVSSSTVSDWANAKKYPRVDKIQAIADYLGVLLVDLREERKTTPDESGADPELDELTALYRSASPETKATALSWLRAAAKALEEQGASSKEK